MVSFDSAPACALETSLQGRRAAGLRDEWQGAAALKPNLALPFTFHCRGDVLLAYQMNGTELLPDHGYPVRPGASDFVSSEH